VASASQGLSHGIRIVLTYHRSSAKSAPLEGLWSRAVNSMKRPDSGRRTWMTIVVKAQQPAHLPHHLFGWHRRHTISFDSSPRIRLPHWCLEELLGEPGTTHIRFVENRTLAPGSCSGAGAGRLRSSAWSLQSPAPSDLIAEVRASLKAAGTRHLEHLPLQQLLAQIPIERAKLIYSPI
jgi:hypothetical protein